MASILEGKAGHLDESQREMFGGEIGCGVLWQARVNLTFACAGSPRFRPAPSSSCYTAAPDALAMS